MTNDNETILIQPINFTESSFSYIKSKLSQLNWSVFLESADLNHINSRWSIYSADPIVTLQSKDTQITIEGIDISPSVQENVLDVCHRIRKCLFNEKSATTNCFNVPFTGGVLGALNYELGYQFEFIKNTTRTKNIDISDVVLGFYDWAIIYDNRDKQFFLVVRKHSLSTTPLSEYFNTRLNWLLNIHHNTTVITNFSLESPWVSNMSQAEYANKFATVQHYILAGDCYQVNLAQRFKADYLGDEFEAYQLLLLQNTPPFSAFLRLPTHAVLSFSPERFLQLTGQKIESKPIKGTRPRFSDQCLDEKSKAELLASPKDHAENLMIVDLLRNDIGKVSTTGSVQVTALFEIESFPAIHHLVSTITSTLKPTHSTETLIQSCFPGGSITGAPKIRAMEIIAELEPHSRSVYCGSIGYIDAQGDMDMNISIRTLLCYQNKIYCWAGGGLVADSKVDHEYKECFDKVSRILPILSKNSTTKDFE
ncbi:MAG: aminodeoxychorismate synthase component I [Psychromonas sp.]|nr:aminodeoxychorismate synthase component I [Psychromonas sp.]